MDITPEQQRKINAHCLKFKRNMQKMVNKRGSGLDSISISVGDKTVKIAERKPHGHT